MSLRSVVPCLSACLSLAFWLAAPDAQAGSYTVTYSKGQSVSVGVNVPGGTLTVPYSGTYGGGASTSWSSAGASATCSGGITATATWQPSGPGDNPPANAIVMETGTASWSGTGVIVPTSKCNDGLGDPEVDKTTPPSQPGAPTSVSGVSTGVHYKLKTNPGPSFTLTPTPSANVSCAVTQGGGNASVNYTVTVSPVTITPGGATPDGSGGYAILVGQGCTAGLNSPLPASNWHWSVTGTTFQDWEPTTPKIGTTPANPQASYFLGGSGPLTNATAKWYWNDPNQATETITCTATVTPPAGQGSPLSVTATQKVTVYLPTWQATGTGGYMQVNTKAPKDTNYELWAGPTAAMLAHQPKQGGGMSWQAYVYTPTTSAFGTGSLQIVQIVTPNDSWTLNTVPPQQKSASYNNVTELDGSCPYENGRSTELAQPLLTNDNPGIALTGSIPILSMATLKDSFIDYLMYLPPGNDTKWIAVAQFAWSINGNATIPTTGNWADYVTQNHSDSAGSVNPSGTTSFGGVYGPDFFPSWTSVLP